MEQKILIGANCYLNNSIFFWSVGNRFCEMLRNIWRGLFIFFFFLFIVVKFLYHKRELVRVEEKRRGMKRLE